MNPIHKKAKQCKVKQGTCQKSSNGYLCSREEKHKGLHHAHANGECLYTWR